MKSGYWCDKCKQMLSESESYHHKDAGHNVVYLYGATDEHFEMAEKISCPDW